MKPIKNFEELRQMLSTLEKRPRIVAVRPTDDASRQALTTAEQAGIADVVSIDAATAEEAAAQAVNMVRRGEADILMKGLIGTDQLLRAVLDKQHGLLPPGAVLTHIAAAEIRGHDRMLFFTDAAVIPYPTDEQRTAQVRYATATAHAFGISQPRLALIHCSEKPSPKFPHTEGYRNIIEMASEGQFGSCIVDGPLDVKTACCRESMLAKGISSPIDGEADVLVFPDIEAGNVFYKTITLFCHARTAGLLQGTTAPVVVPSRGDTAEAKLNSILMATAQWKMND